MSLLGWVGKKLLASAAEGGDRDAFDDRWWTGGGSFYPTAAGLVVTPERALQIPAVGDSLHAISEPIAHLPLKVFRKLDRDEREPAPDHPAAGILHRPLPGRTRFEWLGELAWTTALYSNAYCEWLWDADGFAGLKPWHPDFVQLDRDRRTGEVTYIITDPLTGRQRRLPAELIWHIRALPLDRDGVKGVSRIKSNSETLGHALAVMAYGERYFRNDGQAGGIVRFPSFFKTKEDREKFHDAWNRARTGRNQHKDVILEGAEEYIQRVIQNDHAQFLETRKEMAIEVARIWNVPPHKIRSLDRATFSNIEEQSIAFLTDTLLPWLTLFEQRIDEDIVRPMSEARGLDPDAYFAEFNVLGLLKGAIDKRYEAYSKGIQSGWLSVNDVRRMENMNPVEGGEQYLRAVNMAPLDAPAEPSTDRSPPPAPPEE
jgi:HK97 family phage portal protein